MNVSLDKIDRVAVLLLGGNGTRFGANEPKQFTLFGGKLLFFYPLDQLVRHDEIQGVLLVAPKDYISFVEKTIQQWGFSKIIGVIEGGATRQDSSRRAAEYLRDKGLSFNALVLIHDAARPNLKNEYITENYARALRYGAAVTAIPSTDSIAISEDEKTISQYKDRSKVYQLQTPQTFLFSALYNAHEKAFAAKHSYTDDGDLVLTEEGLQPAIVLGEASNVKVTTIEDLRFFGKGK
jgi:D-ribitol-5-phosphate cytidylyltransferase